MSGRLRIAVIGHVEHVTIGRVPAVPEPGQIVHVDEPRWFPGGGGGVAFWQLLKSDADVHFYTALGNDEAGDQIKARLDATGATVFCARPAQPHTRVLTMIDSNGERTIIVFGAPLQPTAQDDLSWEQLADYDAVYFTARDPELLVLARRASKLVAVARRRPVILKAGIPIDAILGSINDGQEKSVRADYAPEPTAVVMTDGSRGGTVETAAGIERFPSTPVTSIEGGAYGAGDSFAGAFVYFLAAGATFLEAARQAAPFGAAVLSGLDPTEHQAPLPKWIEAG